jgi:transcriptional regulator with XRE-family HTH domain
MSLGERLDRLIKEKGITKYKLAIDLDMPPSAVRNWINYNINPREHTLEKVAKYFRVHPAWLRYGEEEYALELKDRSLKICNEIKRFTVEYPESLPSLKKVIEVFMNEHKKTSAKVTSK